MLIIMSQSEDGEIYAEEMEEDEFAEKLNDEWWGDKPEFYESWPKDKNTAGYRSTELMYALKPGKLLVFRPEVIVPKAEEKVTQWKV
jgi:hypothetical protein